MTPESIEAAKRLHRDIIDIVSGWDIEDQGDLDENLTFDVSIDSDGMIDVALYHGSGLWGELDVTLIEASQMPEDEIIEILARDIESLADLEREDIRAAASALAVEERAEEKRAAESAAYEREEDGAELVRLQPHDTLTPIYYPGLERLYVAQTDACGDIGWETRVYLSTTAFDTLFQEQIERFNDGGAPYHNAHAAAAILRAAGID